MTTRAHLYRPVQDTSGDVQSNVAVRVLQPGTTTPIADTMYVASTGGTTRSNPYTYTDGVISFYLDTPQRVRLGVTVGAAPEVFFEDVDVLSPDGAVGTSGPVLGNGDLIYFPVTMALTAADTNTHAQPYNSGVRFAVNSEVGGRGAVIYNTPDVFTDKPTTPGSAVAGFDFNAPGVYEIVMRPTGLSRPLVDVDGEYIQLIPYSTPSNDGNIDFKLDQRLFFTPDTPASLRGWPYYREVVVVDDSPITAASMPDLGVALVASTLTADVTVSVYVYVRRLSAIATPTAPSILA